MNIIQINSNSEFQDFIKKENKLYLLVFKSDSEQSECAFENLSKLDDIETLKVFSVDVNQVKDVHKQYNITSAPTLLEFENQKLTKVFKGCHEPNFFKSVFENLVNKYDINDSEKKLKRVTVYSTPSCVWCNRLKDYLRKYNYPFTDVDVSKNQQIAEELVRKTGQQGVPQIDIEGNYIVGFDKLKINKLLNINENL